MSDPSGSKTSGGALQTILVAVVIALLAGGSAPWWWNKLFPPRPTPLSNVIPGQTPGSSGNATDTPDPPPPKPTPPTMGALEVGTNLNGGDFAPVGMQSNSAEECSYSCLQDDSCKAMTFVKNPSVTGGVCWLKSAVPAATANAYMTSAVKIYH